MDSFHSSLSLVTSGGHALATRSAVAQPLVWGAYAFDKRATLLTVNNEPVEVTQKEFDLALLLFSHLGKPITRTELFEKIWGREEGFKSRTLDTHVARIRRRLNLMPSNGFRLSSIYGMGYRLDAV